MLLAALIGFAFGFVGSMPIAGPIAVLVLSRALDADYRAAVGVGLGCAVAESVYATLAFFGFAELLAQHAWIEPVSRAVAAAILIGLGASFLTRKQRAGAAPADRGAAGARSFLLGLSITALNPTLIATWTGAVTTLAGTGAVAVDGALAVPFGLSAGAGIFAWYTVLVALVRRSRARFSPATIDKVLRGFGVFVLAVGLWFLARLVQWLLTYT